MLWDYVHFHKTLQYEQKLKKGGILKMKKILTVLLVIAVMFTFSFGSAFAGTFEAKTSEDKAALITSCSDRVSSI